MPDQQYALLVIDMQLVAFDGKITPPIASGPELLNSVASLVSTCRSHGAPVVFLQTCAASGQPYARDAHGWEIHPGVSPRADEKVLFKVGPSAFENPELKPYLLGIGASDVLVCGIWSEGCVAFTCASALDAGFSVCLVRDAHGTSRANASDAAAVVAEQNEQWQKNGARVLPLSAVAKLLGADSP